MASDVAATAPPQLPQSATVFRVRRKRTADPHEALIVSVKRIRQDGFSPSDTIAPLLYHLAATSENPVISSVDCAKLPSNTPLNIIDLKPSAANSNADQQMETECADREEANPLAHLTDAVGEFDNSDAVGDSRRSGYPADRITLNGIPLEDIATTSDYVFDFYWNDVKIQYPVDQLEIRMASREEIEFYTGGGSESSENPDDEDDSNSENNWRNDYPDEESEDDSEDDSDKEYYDEDDLERQIDSFNFSDSEPEYY